MSGSISELEAVGRGAPRSARHVALGDAVAERRSGRRPRSAPPRARASASSRADRARGSPPDGRLHRLPRRRRRPRTAPRGTSSRRRRGRRRRRPRRARRRASGRRGRPRPAETPAKIPSASSSARRPCDRLLVRDEHLPVELRDVEDRRHVAVLERAQAHHRIARQRLGGRDDDVRERLAQPRAGPHQRAAGAEPGDEDVDAVERLRRSRRRCPRSARAGSPRSRTGTA